MSTMNRPYQLHFSLDRRRPTVSSVRIAVDDLSVGIVTTIVNIPAPTKHGQYRFYAVDLPPPGNGVPWFGCSQIDIGIDFPRFSLYATLFCDDDRYDHVSDAMKKVGLPKLKCAGRRSAYCYSDPKNPAPDVSDTLSRDEPCEAVTIIVL